MAYKTTYPYSGQVLKSYENVTDQDIEKALADGHALYKAWRENDQLQERKAILHKVADLLRRDRDKYAEVMTKDMGKLFVEAQGEVDLCAAIADYYADKAEEFFKPQPLETDTGDAYYIKQATGVLLAVEPWNFPFIRLCGSLPLTLWLETPWCSSTLLSALALVKPLKIWLMKLAHLRELSRISLQLTPKFLILLPILG